jgi:hypothetical protein
LRERIKVRGAVKIFSSFFPLNPAGEGKGEGAFKIFPFISSLPLRERTKVRGAVKIFSSFFPLNPAGEGKGEGVFFFFLPLNPQERARVLSPLRERIKVRDAVKFLSFLIKSKDKSSYLPLTLLK